MSSNLMVIVLILGGLIAVASSNNPTTPTPCCRDQFHNNPHFGEVSYCPARDR